MISEELKIRVQADADRATRDLKGLSTTTKGIEGNIKALGMAALKYLGPMFLAGAVGKAGKAAITAAAEYEKLGVSLEVLLGSAEKGQRVFQQLQQFASKTPFQLQQLAEVSTRLMAFGSSAAGITKELEMLGNASLGMPDKLNRIADAYGKLQAKGKASLEELNMFTEAGVPIMEQLRKQLGLTKTELFDYISTGKVGFEDVRVALEAMTTGEGQFAGMMEKQSETLIGLMSTARDNVQILSATLGESLLPSIKNIVTAFTNVVTRITDSINSTRALRLELEGVGDLALEQEMQAIQARMDIISPLIHGTKVGTLIEKQRLRAEAGVRGAIGQTDIANMMMRTADLPRGELVAMYEGLLQRQMWIETKLNVQNRNTAAQAGLSPLLTTGASGMAAGGGVGSPINYTGAYPLNLGQYGPVNSPYGTSAPYSKYSKGDIDTKLGFPLGQELGIDRQSWWDAMSRNLARELLRGPVAPTAATQGNITSPSAMQYGPLGSLLGISPFLPGGGVAGSSIEAMNRTPIPEMPTAGAGMSVEDVKAYAKAIEDLKISWGDLIKQDLINAGVDAFLQFSVALGSGTDAMLEFANTIPELIMEMTKLVGMRMIEFSMNPLTGFNPGLFFGGLALAGIGAGGGAYFNSQRTSIPSSNNGGGSSPVNVVINAQDKSVTEIKGIVTEVLSMSRTGYR